MGGSLDEFTAQMSPASCPSLTSSPAAETPALAARCLVLVAYSGHAGIGGWDSAVVRQCESAEAAADHVCDGAGRLRRWREAAGHYRCAGILGGDVLHSASPSIQTPVPSGAFAPSAQRAQSPLRRTTPSRCGTEPCKCRESSRPHSTNSVLKDEPRILPIDAFSTSSLSRRFYRPSDSYVRPS